MRAGYVESGPDERVYGTSIAWWESPATGQNLGLASAGNSMERKIAQLLDGLKRFQFQLFVIWVSRTSQSACSAIGNRSRNRLRRFVSGSDMARCRRGWLSRCGSLSGSSCYVECYERNSRPTIDQHGGFVKTIPAWRCWSRTMVIVCKALSVRQWATSPVFQLSAATRVVLQVA